MSRGPDAGTMLRRALERSADAAGVTVTFGEIVSVGWASATFAGARHEATVTVAGAGAARWLADLPEADLPMRDHLAADVVVVQTRAAAAAIVARIEALTVEER